MSIFIIIFFPFIIGVTISEKQISLVKPVLYRRKYSLSDILNLKTTFFFVFCFFLLLLLMLV